MVFLLGLGSLLLVTFFVSTMRPKHSLKARARDRYRRDRKATRIREREEMLARRSSHEY